MLIFFLRHGVAPADRCSIYSVMFTQQGTCGGACKVAKESESTASHQGLTDGQVPGSAQDEATVYWQINKSEAETDRPQSHHSDRQAGAKGRRLQVGPSQRCNVLVINCQSPSVWWAEALSQGEALIIVTATVALTLASTNNA
ncbi:hypothetical protein ATANTOWER_005851 [Ataeniobius toweri]|uniref:Uncharacterized protein n=1 Tax=Ataeniobius toweri TaxID=208326 RepID=A0ABU7BFU9_9TELE|nr:hypothetical protein [Ataeniobius toweri]